jgi:hypothetical protein
MKKEREAILTKFMEGFQDEEVNYNEYELGETYSNYHTALEAVKSAIYKYSHIRPHRSVGFMVPVEAHVQNGPLKKHWRKRNNVPKAETVIRDVSVPVNQK